MTASWTCLFSIFLSSWRGQLRAVTPNLLELQSLHLKSFSKCAWSEGVWKVFKVERHKCPQKDICLCSAQTLRVPVQNGTAWPHTDVLCSNTATARHKWALRKMSDTGLVIKLWRPRFIHSRKICIKECQLTRTLSLAENDWAKVCQGTKCILLYQKCHLLNIVSQVNSVQNSALHTLLK